MKKKKIVGLEEMKRAEYLNEAKETTRKKLEECFVRLNMNEDYLRLQVEELERDLRHQKDKISKLAHIKLKELRKVGNIINEQLGVLSK